MAIRIYSLAKELKIENKELVDICTRVGITGKGSALASLDDDEVQRVRAYLSGGVEKPPPKPSAGPLSALFKSTGASRPPVLPKPAPKPAPSVAPPPPAAPPPPVVAVEPPPPAAPEPEPVPELVAEAPPPVAPPAPVVELPPPPAAPEMPAPALPVSSPLASHLAPAEPEPVESLKREPLSREASPPAIAASAEGGASSAEGGAATAAPPRPGGSSLAPSRENLYGPVGRSGKIRVIEARGKGRPGGGESARPQGDRPKPGGRREPIVALAPMPEVKQPTAPAPAEPKAQKPDIRLPKDAIAGQKAGKSAPLKKFTEQHEEKSRAAAKGKVDAKPEDAGAVKPGKGKRGRDGAPAEGEGEGVDSRMASTRASRTKARKPRPAGAEDDDGGRRVIQRRSGGRGVVRGGTAAPRKDKVALELPCSIRAFSEAAGVPAARILRSLMDLGVGASINASLDAETAAGLCEQFGVELEIRQPQTLEEKLQERFADLADDPADLSPRPPVATFLGHVDHGKTSLLDRIIGTNVVAGEAGGITQHIRAYQVQKDGRPISFVDTPGHEAFTEMRARGANVTDVAVLVVAADDGVMPQTEEAISHAKAANVPIVVALNKIDLPGANPDRAMQGLAQHGLLPSQWGGDVEVVPTSAITGQGVDELLDTLLGIAELHEYKANPARPAQGVCLEAEQEGARGVIAKFMVRQGTLKVGDIVVCGAAHGRIKAMYDTLQTREKRQEAGPATPVNIIGLDTPPEAGEAFYVLDDIAEARNIAAERAARGRDTKLSGRTVKVSFEEFQRRLQTEGGLGHTEEKVSLNLILRADVRGSIEAILKELSKLDRPNVELRILHAAVGAVSVADVTLADASQAVIVGFNVVPDEAAHDLAEEKHVEIRRYDVIYKVADDIKALLEGKLKPEERVVDMGRAVVLRTFSISRVGVVAGCRVLKGTIARDCRIRVYRDGRAIGDYAIDSLKREKDDAREVQHGMECGIKLAGFNDVKEADLLEAYKVEEFARTL